VATELQKFPEINNQQSKDFFANVFQKMDNPKFDIKLAQFGKNTIRQTILDINKSPRAYQTITTP